MYFRRRENTFTFGLSTATRFAPPLFAQAIVQLVYLTQARGEAEAPKTGLVDVLCTAETVFGTKAPVVP